MNIKNFYLVVGVLFLLILVLHLARIILGWSAVIGGVAIPVWASWVAVFVAGFLLYHAYKFKKRLQ